MIPIDKKLDRSLNKITNTRALERFKIAPKVTITTEEPTNHPWTEFVSEELKQALFNLKSDNGNVPLATVDRIIQLFTEDIELLGNNLLNAVKGKPTITLVEPKLPKYTR